MTGSRNARVFDPSPDGHGIRQVMDSRAEGQTRAGERRGTPGTTCKKGILGMVGILGRTDFENWNVRSPKIFRNSVFESI
jgi:hypothetical protein